MTPEEFDALSPEERAFINWMADLFMQDWRKEHQSQPETEKGEGEE